MNIKIMLYFATGMVVGSAATFFVVKGYFQRQCEEMVEEAWDDANEHFLKVAAVREKAEKNRKEKEEKAKEMASKEIEEESDEEEKPERTVDIKKIRKEASKAVKSYRRNVFDDPPNNRDIHVIEDGDWDEDVDDSPSEGLREDPYVISDDQFANENTYWDKVTIYIYTDGNAVEAGPGGTERVVDDIESLIGKENYDRLEDLADASGTVLIRNEMRSSDYELLLIDETYIPDTAPVRDD